MKVVLIAVLVACFSVVCAYEDAQLVPAVVSMVAAIKSTSNDARVDELRAIFSPATKDPFCSKCPSCTACLQCCMNDKIAKFEVTPEEVELIQQLDWKCPCTACPLQCGFRQSLVNKFRSQVGDMLAILNFNCQEGSIDCKIKKVLDSFMPKNINSVEDDFTTFFDKVQRCPCTACPLSCAIRAFTK
jgi:hypothetical protein